MHVQTHVLSGWCLANCLPGTARQRMLAMLAATLADLDGLSYIGGENAFQYYHHRLTHGIVFAVVMSAVLAAVSPRRIQSFFLYLALAHVHLVLDYYGSGSLWRIHYLWPFSDWYVVSTGWWELASWQNYLAAGIFLIWTILIAIYAGRTPLEALMPSLDRQLVAMFRQWTGRGTQASDDGRTLVQR